MRIEDLSRLEDIKSRLSNISENNRNSTPPILRQILGKSKNKSTCEKAIGATRESMSLRRIDYNEIFKNNVYKHNFTPSKLPPVKYKANKIKPEIKRTEVNKSALSFPNSELSLDINTEFDKSSNRLKYVFLVKNLQSDRQKELENKITERISKEIKKLALKQIIEERCLLFSVNVL